MGFVSRRRFLGSAAGIPLALDPRLARLAAASLTAGSGRRDAAPARATCLLVNAGEHCALPESLAGFARGLEAASIPSRRVAAVELEPARLIVVPGALLPSSEFAATLSRLCKLGSTVIYESGAAYSSPETFEIEQGLVRTYFDLRVEAPVELWSANPGTAAAAPPYVHYNWPWKATVRDFSRAIPISAALTGFSRPDGTEPIIIAYAPLPAHTRYVPVASRTRLGDADFIFLGSPLGPHLGSRDREAQVLLEALLLQRYPWLG